MLTSNFSGEQSKTMKKNLDSYLLDSVSTLSQDLKNLIFGTSSTPSSESSDSSENDLNYTAVSSFENSSESENDSFDINPPKNTVENYLQNELENELRKELQNEFENGYKMVENREESETIKNGFKKTDKLGQKMGQKMGEIEFKLSLDADSYQPTKALWKKPAGGNLMGNMVVKEDIWTASFVKKKNYDKEVISNEEIVSRKSFASICQSQINSVVSQSMPSMKEKNLIKPLNKNATKIAMTFQHGEKYSYSLLSKKGFMIATHLVKTAAADLAGLSVGDIFITFGDFLKGSFPGLEHLSNYVQSRVKKGIPVIVLRPTANGQSEYVCLHLNLLPVHSKDISGKGVLGAVINVWPIPKAEGE